MPPSSRAKGLRDYSPWYHRRLATGGAAAETTGGPAAEVIVEVVEVVAEATDGAAVEGAGVTAGTVGPLPGGQSAVGIGEETASHALG
jgi:hypothetical protein